MPAPIIGPDESVREGYEDYTVEDWKRMRLFYQAMVSDVDRNVGKILDTLEQEGLREDTLVIFTSDHGENAGDHGRLGKGSPGFDCIINTPLIMRCPGLIDEGKVLEGLVESVDVVPTILDCCTIQADPSVQGRSLLPLLRGQSDDARDSVFMEAHNPGISTTKTVRTVDYMYSIVSGTRGTQEYLFDLKNDPNEIRNVVDEPDHAGKLSEMRKLLLERTIEAEGDGRPAVARY